MARRKVIHADASCLGLPQQPIHIHTTHLAISHRAGFIDCLPKLFVRRHCGADMVCKGVSWTEAASETETKDTHQTVP